MTIPVEYTAILEHHGRPGFAPGELVNPNANNRKDLPPRWLWSNMAKTLDVANMLRTRMIAHGATGLTVHAAYRPHGGAPRSAHKVNAALDLDLIPADVKRVDALGFDLRVIFAEEAVRLWCEHGAEYEIGLGHYGSAGRDATWRIHIDTTKCRTWQHAGSRIVRPPAAHRIASRLGLKLPTDHETEDEDT